VTDTFRISHVKKIDPYPFLLFVNIVINVPKIPIQEKKELTDWALKLAEVGKPKSNWKVQRVLGAWPFSLLDLWVSYPYRIFRVPERKFETARSALS
jgi:hypothetical protein